MSHNRHCLQVKAAAALNTNTVKAEIVSLEDAVTKLLHLLLPDYTPSMPFTPEVSFSSDQQKSIQSDQLSVATSTPESPQSSLPLQISSDFTDLPLNYHKVMASEQPPLSRAAPVPSQSLSPTINMNTEICLDLESVDSSLQSSSLGGSSIGSPLDMFGKNSSLERSPSIEKSSQTTQPSTEDQSSQTPNISRPPTRDSWTQIPMSVTANSWTQTPHTIRPVMADGVSQTSSTRLVSCSSQTTRTRQADKSSQTPGAWKLAMGATVPVKSKPTDRSLPHTPSHDVKWGEGPCNEHIMPHGRHLMTPASPPTACYSGKNDLHKLNGAVELPRIFVAVMDYDPNSLCTTGRPEMELHFHIGEGVNL